MFLMEGVLNLFKIKLNLRKMDSNLYFLNIELVGIALFLLKTDARFQHKTVYCFMRNQTTTIISIEFGQKRFVFSLFCQEIQLTFLFDEVCNFFYSSNQFLLVGKEMSESSCNFFCFQICKGASPPQSQRPKIEQPQKISLKGAPTHPKVSIAKIDSLKSVSAMMAVEKIQSTTDRNRNHREKQTEITLFKRKMEIEKQIKSMNQSIMELNHVYQHKIQQLRDVQSSLQSLLNN